MSNTDCVEIDGPSRSALSLAVISRHSASSTEDNIPFIPATLTVSNLHYEVIIKERCNNAWKKFSKKHNRVQKALIANVSLMAAPGRVLAIMGPSGSGKTTLLDMIANRRVRHIGKDKGEILLNGFPVKQYGSVSRRLFGYVAQHNDLMETFTVQEILTFAAKMRLPRSMSDQDKIARVYAVMQELNLTHIKDTKVGGTLMRGISGGEKRRVIVAEELLSSPSILLLDEPTSGLSSTDALNIVKVIKGLAAKGRTVIMVIHQPRSDIYELFDDLLLLSQGMVVYFGKAQSASTYFEELGYDCPVGWNIADYLLDLVSEPHETSSGERLSAVHKDFATYYSNYLSSNPEAYLTQLLNEHNNRVNKIEGESLMSRCKKEYTTEYATTALTQTLMLTHRNLTNLARHPLIFRAAAVIHVVSALVVGSVFSGLKDRPEMGAISFNKSIVLFFISSFLGMITFAALPQILVERSTFLRERAAGMYRTSSYFIAKTIVETFSYAALSVIFAAITYYLVGFQGSVIYYFMLVAAFVNVSLSLVAAIGARLESAEIGIILKVLISSVAVLFSGFLVGRTEIPRGWIWALWASYYQWALSGLMDNEFSDGSLKGTTTLLYFGINQVEILTKKTCLLVLLAYYIVLRVIGFLLLRSKRV
ncbi:hypothetical protein EMPS_09909 [Entomortierella parvispora]|uniref:ABC transporter domain-containing protein n=1 Tax=Entomortierella parvispora TaxID=205924 RepID=A0A9P3HIX0_9FUNG|nr:hypothetical protein EMPS_09909 [Entomortierella parvispora]